MKDNKTKVIIFDVLMIVLVIVCGRNYDVARMMGLALILVAISLMTVYGMYWMMPDTWHKVHKSKTKSKEEEKKEEQTIHDLGNSLFAVMPDIAGIMEGTTKWSIVKYITTLIGGIVLYTGTFTRIMLYLAELWVEAITPFVN